MGLKKYEIITVGSDKRVRALRSWQVGDRYVNIGDVGGIVYDEKTLSQDGACWLFRGNFGFPGARIGGDSIVDVGETTLGATGAPAVDILGSSVVVCGSKLRLESDQTAAGAVVLTANDFEPGTISYMSGTNWETWKRPSPNYLRTKAPIFAGGNATTLKLDVPGYSVQAYVLDRDGKGMTATASVDTGEGVTLAVPAGQYFLIRLSKKPVATVALSDVTTAKITFTGTYESKLSIIDSRVEINPATSTNTVFVKTGGSYTMAPGVKYPEYIIRNSKVSINVPVVTNRSIRLMGQIIESTALLDCTTENLTMAGTYRNVNNLMASGVLTTNVGTEYYSAIQATDCNNFAVSPAIFPGLAAAQTANMPFIFQGCNVPNGMFYHNAQIANTYKNVDFALAQSDLGKTITSSEALVSSEVEGMYRLYSASGFGALAESHESVRFVTLSNIVNSYGTAIYKDAYLSGLFDIAGTNAFGHKVRSHPLAQVLNVQPRAVQGEFNTRTAGKIVTGVVPSTSVVSIATPFRVAGSKGFTVLTPPEGLQVLVLLTDINNKVVTNTGWVSVETNITPVTNAASFYAYISVRKTALTDLKPVDVAGTQIVTYNGCKIVNTGKTAVNMKGNIRVEDNATLVNASVTGSGYFGGNSVVYYNPTEWASLDFNGTVYMKNNTVFAPSELTGAIALVRMEGNAKFTGSVGASNTSLSVIMRDNAVIEGKANLRSSVVVMSGNSKITATGHIMPASRGVLVMEENASIEADIAAIGTITLSGNYKGNVPRTWTGKRTITDVNAPKYDNNVKTQYDF